ncbi:hypothetical protein Hanom_Chr05g00448401 [Helianthus anomalus]
MINNCVFCTAPLSLLTAKDRRNKRGQQLFHTRATGKPKTHNLHFRALLISLMLLPPLHMGATLDWGHDVVWS